MAPPPRGSRSSEHHHESRQVLVGRAQSVCHPGAHRRPARQNRPGVHLAHRADVIQTVRPAGADDVISSTCSAMFAYQSDTHMPLWPYCFQLRREAIRALCAGAAGSLRGLADRIGDRLAVELGEQRLGIEQIHLAGAAFHEKEDDGLGRRRDGAASWAAADRAAPPVRRSRLRRACWPAPCRPVRCRPA